MFAAQKPTAPTTASAPPLRVPDVGDRGAHAGGERGRAAWPAAAGSACGGSRRRSDAMRRSTSWGISAISANTAITPPATRRAPPCRRTGASPGSTPVRSRIPKMTSAAHVDAVGQREEGDHAAGRAPARHARPCAAPSR